MQKLHASRMLSDKNNLSFIEARRESPNNRRCCLVKHKRNASKFANKELEFRLYSVYNIIEGRVWGFFGIAACRPIVPLPPMSSPHSSPEAPLTT